MDPCALTRYRDRLPGTAMPSLANEECRGFGLAVPADRLRHPTFFLPFFGFPPSLTLFLSDQ